MRAVVHFNGDLPRCTSRLGERKSCWRPRDISMAPNQTAARLLLPHGCHVPGNLCLSYGSEGLRWPSSSHNASYSNASCKALESLAQAFRMPPCMYHMLRRFVGAMFCNPSFFRHGSWIHGIGTAHRGHHALWNRNNCSTNTLSVCSKVLRKSWACQTKSGVHSYTADTLQIHWRSSAITALLLSY